MADELTHPTDEAPPAEVVQEVPRAVFNPPIDIYETDEGLVLLADLPSVNQQGVELQVQDNRLTLFGRGKSPVPPEARVVYREYQEGDYLRSFILSDEVDHQRIRARLNNGVLEVVLPKAARVQPRKIQVSTE
jgi:HSP20 family protein